MSKKCQEDTGFWKYLLEHSLLTAEEISSLQGCCKSKGVLLGQQLLKNRVLTVAQVMRILDLQADEPDLRVGQIAIREGMLAEDQLEAALLKQRSSMPHPAELVLREGALRQKELLEALIGYVKHLEAD